jgi:hypothetical protein
MSPKEISSNPFKIVLSIYEHLKVNGKGSSSFQISSISSI